MNPEFLAYFSQKEPISTGEDFLVEIPFGRVHGFGTIITADGGSVVSDASISWKFLGGSDNALLNKKRIHRPKRLKGTTAVSAVWGGWGYYHWLIEELPRLVLLLQSEHTFKNLICNAKKDFQFEALNLLGVDSRIIKANSESSYVCDKLITTSFVGRPGFPSQSVLRLLSVLKSLVLKNAHHFKVSEFGRRVYVSRNKSHRRLVLNEEELLKTLKPYGFQKVYLENLSFAQQVLLFDKVEIVIAPHGAGLANLVFCRPNIHVIELFNSRYVFWCFYQLARQNELYYHAFHEVGAESVMLDRRYIADGVLADCLAVKRRLEKIVDQSK